MGPEIWRNNEGDIDPEGLGWVPRVREIWKGEIFAMGTFVKITKNTHPQASVTTGSHAVRTFGFPSLILWNDH